MGRTHRTPFAAGVALLALAAVQSANAQCPRVWVPDAGPGGNADGIATAVAVLANGDLVLGGAFLGVAVPPPAIMRRDATGWHAMGAGILGGIHAILPLDGGSAIVGGSFGAPGASIARWDGAAWHPLGSGMNGAVNALVRLPDGTVVAGGAFTDAGGVAANCVAAWDGTAWSTIGAGAAALPLVSVHSLAVTPSGELLAAGFSGGSTTDVWRWSGTAWTSLVTVNSGGSFPASIQAIAALPGGDVFAAGQFASMNAQPVAGFVRSSGGVWTGAGLSGIGLRQLLALPDGSLIAVGSSGAVHHLRNGVWVGPPGVPNGDVKAAAWSGDAVLVAGAFGSVGATPSPRLARLASTCPASAATVGAGCVGSGGLNELTATALPWTGATFHAEATGMPAAGLALGVTGFSTIAVPLPSILPQGVAGCSALVAPDLLELLPITGPTLQTSLALPATPSLAGAVFHHQVVPFDWPVAGLLAITSTNALTLTIGAF